VLTVSYLHPRGIPFPPRYRCNFRTAIGGAIPIATAPATYSLTGSSLNLPFNGGGWPGVLVANITTLMPAGFRNLCGSLGPYTSYRVFKTHVSVKFVPTGADVITVCLVPCQSAAAPASVGDAMAEGRAKTVTVQAGTVTKEIKISLETNVFYGVSLQSVQDDVAGYFQANYNAAPINNFPFYLVWTTQAGGNTAAAVQYTVELIQEAELFNLLPGALLDA